VSYGFSACAVLSALLAAGPACAAGVVSLNLCTDELLLALAPERVAAVSKLARDPTLSVMASAALTHPWVRPDAEAVLRLHPDLVLAGQYGAQAALSVLRSRGVAVVQVAEPVDFAGVSAEVTQVAAALGVPARGATIVARMQARLASVQPRHGERAVFWEARGFTAGPGSFADSVLRAAGYKNAGNGRAVGVEAMVMHPPDVLVVEQAPAYPSLSTDLLTHPALAGMTRRVIPPALMACAGPWSVQAVEMLAGRNVLF
jgi:iron complex transport system substrate-binding protein